MKIINQTTKEVVTSKVKFAESILGRMKGLMFESEKSFHLDAMVIKPCNSIHTFFMNFNIDVFFLDQYGKVLKIIPNMKPYRISSFVFNAFMVLEIKSSCNLAKKINLGDSLEFKDD